MLQERQAQQQHHEIPFLATPNGLITLLVIAMIAPIIIPGAGVAVSLTLPFMVMAIAWMQPSLGRRWFVLAAIPLVLYGILTTMILFFSW
jgi:hypothetical protein